MIAISYTLTPTIKDYLLDIEKFRRNILMTPVAPSTEHRLRWTAAEEHIYGSLALAGTPMTKPQLRNLLLHPVKHPTGWESEALAYKNTLEIIRADWTANQRPIQTSHIGALSLICLPHRIKHNMQALKESENDLKQLFAYADSQQDHPLILAGVLYGQVIHTKVGETTRGIVPRLITTLVLAKYGYDCRGLLALESQWVSAADSHRKALRSIEAYRNLTAWLEHFIITARTGYESLYTQLRDVTHPEASVPAAQTWNLNPREERILRHLEHPEAKITNKITQRLFRISQVTASRDLSHLASLGLLLTHGKGRSVYYTKA